MKTAWGLLIAAIAASGLAQTPAPAAQVSLKAPSYTLYAPSASEAAQAQQDLDFAVAQFKYYFGEPPPPVAVLIFDSAQDLEKYDFSSFKQAHQRYLAWLSDRALASAAAAPKIAPIPGLGIIVANATGSEGVKVAATLPLPNMPADLKKDDVIETLNSQKCSSVGDFQTLYGQIEPGGKIHLEVKRGSDQHLSFNFNKPASDAKLTTTSTPAGATKTKTLSHEAGHVFFEAWVDQRLGSQAPESAAPAGAITYGHPAVPAWFNEAAATLLESPALQKWRYDFLQQHMQEAVPLRELFTMKHPVIADQQEALKQAQAAAQKQGGTSVVVIQTADNSATDKEKLFYAESLSVAQFLAAQEGPGFVRQVAEGLCRGMSMQDILHSAKNSPADPDRLAEAWRQWLAKRDGRMVN